MNSPASQSRAKHSIALQ